MCFFPVFVGVCWCCCWCFVRARSRHSTRPYRELRRFRTCPQHRTQATLERSKVYWSLPLLLHAQGQRGYSYKTSPQQHQQGYWNRNSRSVDPHDQEIQQRESRATADRRGSKSLSEKQGSKCTNQSCWKTTNLSRASCFIESRMTSRPHPEED